MVENVDESTTRHNKLNAIKSTQLFLVAAICLITVTITILCIGFLVRYEVHTDVWDVDSVSYWKEVPAEEQRFYYNDGIEELKNAIKIKWELEDARNVIIFIMHGIGDEALAAVRFNANERRARKAAWESFSHVGEIVTNCSATNGCDAYSFGTALFGGVKTIQGLGGLDSAVKLQNCTESMNEKHHIKSILEMGQLSGFRTGFVTTNRVGSPLMAALYAHTPDTKWECDEFVPPEKQLQGCRDIVAQLIDEEVGSNINVIMGGGRQTLVSNVLESNEDKIDIGICKSQDGRSFIRHWRIMKSLKEKRNTILQNSSDLNRLNGSNVDYVLGIFSNGNIQSTSKREEKDYNTPELRDMAKVALQVLRRKNERFLLVIENGNESGNNILQKVEDLRRLNTTMFQMKRDKSTETLSLVLFIGDGQNAGGTTKSERIFGNIRLFAEGPSSYLFKGKHDETYIAHAITYALKIGNFRKPI